MLEASAIVEKTKKETAILDIDQRVKLLRESKKLIDEGIDIADIDAILPLPEK